MAKETSFGMWTLLVLLFPLVYADSTSVRVIRDKEEPDSFRLPQSFESCRRQNECNRFNANLSPTASIRGECFCSCSRQRAAATFGVKNGYWQCVDNKEIHQRELSDCERIHFITETDTDLLRVFKEGESAAFNISFNYHGFVKTGRFKFWYQACNGGWIPLNNTDFAPGLGVTKLWTPLTNNYTYMLQIDEAKRKPKDHMCLQGRVIKLAIPGGPSQRKPFCLLFKIAGVMECPLKHILGTGIPLTRTPTAAEHSVFSEAVIPTFNVTATKIGKSQTIPTATKAPKTTFKVTHPSATDGHHHTLHNASAQFSVPLIAGAASISGIVLSVVFFVVLSKCRKGEKRHLSSTSRALEPKATKLDDLINQYSIAEEKAPYQSLSPSPDGAMERGVYMARYNVPGTIPAINSSTCSERPEGRDPCSSVERPTEKPASDEYDYPESSLVARNNLFKIDFPGSKEKRSNSAEENAPYYYVLDMREEGLQSEKLSEGACEEPDERAPCYQVLEGPDPLDPQDSSLRRDGGGAYFAHHENPTDDKHKEPSDGVGTFNCGVKGPISSSDNEECCDYKELKSDALIPQDYQALHKYAYVTIGDPKDSRYK